MDKLKLIVTVFAIGLLVSSCSSDDEKEIIIPTTDLGFQYWSDALETNKLYRIDNIEEFKDAKGEYYVGFPEINFDKNTLLLVSLPHTYWEKHTRTQKLVEINSNLYNLDIRIVNNFSNQADISYPFIYIAVLTPKIKEDILVQHSVNTKIEKQKR